MNDMFKFIQIIIIIAMILLVIYFTWESLPLLFDFSDDITGHEFDDILNQ